MPLEFPPIFSQGKPVKYSSASTRVASLDVFCGGAQGDEVNTPPKTLPGEVNENLIEKFKSNVAKIDMPRSWGYPNIIRKLADKVLGNAEAIQSWRRKKGEPLYKK